MSWFKVDDKLHDHRKARAAGATAMGVWTLAGSWSADNLTDGFIPATILPRWGRPRDAKRLVDVGLWHADEQDGETGWRFHEWDKFQPTKAQKLAEREAKIQAGKVGGLASGRSRREAKSKQAASHPVELPTRPDPFPLNPTPDVSDADQQRSDVDRLCRHLAANIEANGVKRPEIGKRWRDAARLLMDRDGYGEQQVHVVIDWATRDPFWKANILSMPTLRDKFPQLVIKAGVAGRADNVLRLQPNGQPFIPLASDDRR